MGIMNEGPPSSERTHLLQTRLVNLVQHVRPCRNSHRRRAREFHGTMAPPVVSFPAADVAAHAQLDATGRKRKLEGGGNVDLGGCELLSMVQYSCHVDTPHVAGGKVRCFPVERLFRR